MLAQIKLSGHCLGLHQKELNLQILSFHKNVRKPQSIVTAHACHLCMKFGFVLEKKNACQLGRLNTW